MNFSLTKVDGKDLNQLTDLKKDSFKEEFKRLGFTPPEMISYDWHSDMYEKSVYYKIIHNDAIIGGINLFYHKAEGYLCCIFIKGEFQNMGIGQRVITAVEDIHRDIKKWTLETPARSIQNKVFYEKCGYSITDEVIPKGAPEGFTLFQFTKIIDI